MTAPHQSVFTFEYPDPESARRVARCLGPELDDIDGDRTRAMLDRSGATIELTILADDLVALRAGCNTWATLATVAETAGRATRP